MLENISTFTSFSKKQSGEIATSLTLFGLGLMLVGTIVGAFVASRKEVLLQLIRAAEMSQYISGHGTLAITAVNHEIQTDGKVLFTLDGYFQAGANVQPGYRRVYLQATSPFVLHFTQELVERSYFYPSTRRTFTAQVTIKEHWQGEPIPVQVVVQPDSGSGGRLQFDLARFYQTPSPTPSTTPTHTPTPTESQKVDVTSTPEPTVTLIPTSTPGLGGLVATATPVPEISCKIEAVRNWTDENGNNRVRVAVSNNNSQASWLELFITSVSRGNSGWYDYLFNPNSCSGTDCTISGEAPNNISSIPPGEYWIACNAGNGSGRDAPDNIRKCTGNPFGIPSGWQDCGGEDREKISFAPPPTSTPIPLPAPTNVTAQQVRMGERGEIPVCGQINITWDYTGSTVDYFDIRFYSASNERKMFRLAGYDASRSGNHYSWTTPSCFFLAPGGYDDSDPEARVSVTAIVGEAQSQSGFSERFMVSALAYRRPQGCNRSAPPSVCYQPCMEQCGQFDNRTRCRNQGGYCSYQGNCPQGEEWLMWCGRVGGTDYGACCRASLPTATPTPTPTPRPTATPSPTATPIPSPEETALSGTLTVVTHGEITIEEIVIPYEDISYPIPVSATKQIQATEGVNTFRITSSDNDKVPIISSHQFRILVRALDSRGKFHYSTSIETVTAPASGIELRIDVTPGPTIPIGDGTISGQITVVGKPPGINLDLVRIFYGVQNIPESSRYVDLDDSRETQQYQITGLATGIEYGIYATANTKTWRNANNRPEDCEEPSGFPPMECLVVPSPSAAQDFIIILPPDPTPVHVCEADNEISGRVRFNGIPDQANYSTSVMVLYPVQWQSSNLHEFDYRFLVEPERMWDLAASIWKRYMRNGEESWAEYQRFPLGTYPLPPPQCELSHSVDYRPPPDDCTEPNCPAVLEFIEHVFSAYEICSPVQEWVLECGVVPLIGVGGTASCPIAIRRNDSGTAVHEFIHIWQYNGGMSNPVSFVQDVVEYACQNGINNEYLQHFPQDCQNFCDFSDSCAERTGWTELQAFIGDEIVSGGSGLLSSVWDYYNGFFCGVVGSVIAPVKETLDTSGPSTIGERMHSRARTTPTFILLDRAQRKGQIPDRQSAIALGNVFSLFAPISGTATANSQNLPYEKPEELATVKATAPDGTVVETKTDFNGSYILQLPTDAAGKDYTFSFTSRYGKPLYHDIKQTIYPGLYYNINAQIGLVEKLGVETLEVDIPQIILPVNLKQGENLVMLPSYLRDKTLAVDLSSQITAQGGRIAKVGAQISLDEPLLIGSDKERLIYLTVQAKTKERKPTPKEIAPLAASDINSDGVINLNDFSLLLANYGMAGEKIPADINKDRVVNALDLSQLLELLRQGYGSVRY